MKLTTQIRNCRKCKELVQNRTQPVIGIGPVPCDIVFLGEAPGANEDKEGVPFVGRAGAILEAAAFSAGLKRGIDYHILNVLKCRPPENRDPLPQELQNCIPFLEAQLEVVKPKVIVALGRYAQAFILRGNSIPLDPSKIKVMQNMGRVVSCKNYQAILSCHPSFISRNRNPEILAAFKKHIKKAVKLVDKSP